MFDIFHYLTNKKLTHLIENGKQNTLCSVYINTYKKIITKYKTNKTNLLNKTIN